MNVHDAAASSDAKVTPANRIAIAYRETGDGTALVPLKGAHASTVPAGAESPVENVDHQPILGEVPTRDRP